MSWHIDLASEDNIAQCDYLICKYSPSQGTNEWANIKIS